jgi:cold shock CspA family protein
MRGTCLQFDRVKGFGFLLPSPADAPTLPDVFCHFSAIQHTAIWKRRFLLPGFNVEFDVVFEPDDVDEEHPRAVNVRVVPPFVIAIQRAAAPKVGERS